MEEQIKTPKRRHSDDSHPARRASDNFECCPKYDKHELTEEQLEEIATKAAAKAVDMAKNDFYKDVGETLVKKLLWLIGASAVGLYIWMQKHNII